MDVEMAETMELYDTRFVNALWEFWNKWWNDTGIYDCDDYDGKYSYVENKDIVELSELADKVAEFE